MTIGGGGAGFWMTTADVDAMGWISTGIFSPWAAACSITGRTRWVGDSCACGPSRVRTWWSPPDRNCSAGSWYSRGESAGGGGI